MVDNLKMAAVGTQFSDSNISLAWGVGRDASEVVAVPPASRSVALQQAILAGVVVETADPVTVDPDPQPTSVAVRIVGELAQGDVPIWDPDLGHFVPGTAGGTVGSISDVPGLPAALDAKVDVDALPLPPDQVVGLPEALAAVPIDLATIVTAYGDMLINIGGTNVARTGTASASSVGDGTSPAGMIDGLEPADGYPVGLRMGNGAAGNWGKVDLGSAIAIGSVRLLMGTQSDRVTNHYDLQYSVDNVNWTTAASLNGTPVERDHTFIINPAITARYWRCLVGATISSADIVEFQIFAASALSATPTTAIGRSLLTPATAAALRAIVGVGRGIGEYASKYNPDHETPAVATAIAEEFNGSTTMTWDTAPTVTDDLTSMPGFYRIRMGTATRRYLSKAWTPGASDLTVCAKVSGAVVTGGGAIAVFVGDAATPAEEVRTTWEPDNGNIALYNRTAGSSGIVASAAVIGHQHTSLYLRLTRAITGPAWIASYSFDGLTWYAVGATGTKTLTVSRVGLELDSNHDYTVDWVRAWTSIVTKVGA